MSKINIKDQLICLRKLKGITQEELARQLGVTNQSVSKWEAGICCPDIQLLPDIAEYFNVSVDELLGCTKKEETEEEIMLSIKNIFKRTGKEQSHNKNGKHHIKRHNQKCCENKQCCGQVA